MARRVFGPSAFGGPIDWCEIAGHSLAAAGGARNLPEGGYAFRTATALGARRIRDYSIGGGIACWPNGYVTGDGGYPQILQNVLRPGSVGLATASAPYIPKSQLVLCHFGLNDLGEIGSQTPLPFQTALRTIMARFCSAALWEIDNTAWKFTAADGVAAGGWATLSVSAAPTTAAMSGQPGNAAQGIRFTSTVGDKAVFTVPADFPGGLVAAVGLWFNSTYGQCTYGVKIDGVTMPDLVLTGTQLTDQNASNKHIVHTLRFGTGRVGDPYGAALAAGSHTIELSFKAGNVLAVNFAHVEADPLDGPIFVMPLPNKPASYSLWTTWPRGPNHATDPINDAAVNTWKGVQRAVQAEFPGRVIEVDIDALGLVRTTDGTGDFVADGAHFNERGHGRIAGAIYSAVLSSSLITNRIRIRPAVHPRPYFKQVSVQNGAGTHNTNWSNFGSGLAPLSWLKNDRGQVRIRGAIKAVAGATSTVLVAGTLPKPVYHTDKIITQYDGTTYTERMCRVQSDGSLVLVGQAITTATNNMYLIDFTYEMEV